jgi:hypothetical protein
MHPECVAKNIFENSQKYLKRSYLDNQGTGGKMIPEKT